MARCAIMQRVAVRCHEMRIGRLDSPRLSTSGNMPDPDARKDEKLCQNWLRPKLGVSGAGTSPVGIFIYRLYIGVLTQSSSCALARTVLPSPA